MRRVTRVTHIAAAAIVLLSAPAGLAGQQAPSLAGTQRLADFARAHVAINAARDAFHDRLGRVHDEQGRALAREELVRQVSEILSQASITQQEYTSLTLSVSLDPETRAAFEAMVVELTRDVREGPRPPTRVSTRGR